MGRSQRIIAALATLAALGAALAQPAFAAWSNDPLTFVLDEREIHQPVDRQTWCLDCNGVDYTTQEPWVINPTSCMWDTDDQFTYRNVGNVLAAGTTATIADCELQGGEAHRASTRLSSPSDALVVTYGFSWDGGMWSQTIPAVYDPASRRWRYDGCITPATGGMPVEIADSHGGTAVEIDITVTVHNPTGQRVTKTGGSVSFGWIPYFVAGC